MKEIGWKRKKEKGTLKPLFLGYFFFLFSFQNLSTGEYSGISTTKLTFCVRPIILWSENNGVDLKHAFKGDEIISQSFSTVS